MLNELSLFWTAALRERVSTTSLLLCFIISPMTSLITLQLMSKPSRIKSLPDVPFHASPLMNGNDEYEGFDMATRKSS